MHPNGLWVACVLLAATFYSATAASCSGSSRSCKLLELNYNAWQEAHSSGQHECSWPGITCRQAGDEQLVEKISVPAKGIEGSLPSWGGIQGIKLVHLDLSSNKLSGTLSTDWGFIQSPLQYLNLSHNMISGNLPDAWGWGIINDLRQMDLSYNKLAGTLPAQWATINFTELYLDHNQLTGTLPAYWASFSSGSTPGSISEMQGSLTALGLSGNKLTGTLPTEWRNFRGLASMNLSDQGTGGFSGEMPNTWRQLCVNRNLTSMGWSSPGSSVVPSGISNLEYVEGWRVGLKQDWKENGCVYQFAKEFVFALMLGIPGIAAMMLIIGTVLRNRLRAYRAKKAAAAALKFSTYSVSAKLSAMQRLYEWLDGTVSNHGRVVYGVGKLVVIIIDAVSDCLTIKQVWGSWVAWMLLACVFAPDVITSLCLAVCGPWASRSSSRVQPVSNDKNVQNAQNAPITVSMMGDGDTTQISGTANVSILRRLLASPARWVEQMIVTVCSVSNSPAWSIVSAVILWPICLLVMPYMVLLGCLVPYSERNKSFMHHYCKLLHPYRIAVLYDRFSGAIEAPVSAALLIMLLVIGVRPSNSYVVENPIYLYVSLCLSVVHFLFFVWEMIEVWAGATDRKQYVRSLFEPFIVATPISTEDSLEANLSTPQAQVQSGVVGGAATAATSFATFNI